MEILCFFAGIAFVNTKAVYSLLLFFTCFILKPRFSILAWFLAAIGWAYLHEVWIAERNMPVVKSIKNAVIEGRIQSLPVYKSSKIQFEFLANQLNGKPIQATILLSCYTHCPRFQEGEFWRFKVKLRKPQNLRNPGHFDYESWLKARHLHWVGYLRDKKFKKITKTARPQFWLNKREHLANRIELKLNDEEVLGIFQALTLGMTDHLSSKLWDLFRRTGTTHLMVISGSHIGLIAGLAYWFSRRLASRFWRLCLYCPAQKIASIAALFSAVFYALLAGFSISTQRSLLACCFLFLKNFLNYRFTGWQGWRYGLLAVLVVEPHAVLMPGFYLSFLAVANLILLSQRLTRKGLKQIFYLQFGCLLGLMPLTLYWFSYGSLNGFFANLLAIPWVSFVIVPLSLFILLLDLMVDVSSLLFLLTWTVKALLYYLNWIDSFSFINLHFSLSEFLFALALMIAFAIRLILPIDRFLPAVGLLTIAGLFPSQTKIGFNEAVVDVLDVGQGLAVMIKTRNHHLIYDTGMQFYQGSDMGTMAIIPYLEKQGIKKLDKVIISHPDLDHRGGLESLEKSYPIDELLVDNPGFYHRGKSCHHYPAWNWDGVSFRFFAVKQFFKDKNNSSCVLQVATKENKILLTGDIERLAETYLTETYGPQLQSTVLLVGHHGSKTSSSLPFIKQVSPKFAIISAGFDNRYHFPHPKTLATFTQQKIRYYNTAECGMVTFKLKEGGQPTCYKN